MFRKSINNGLKIQSLFDLNKIITTVSIVGGESSILIEDDVYREMLDRYKVLNACRLCQSQSKKGNFGLRNLQKSLTTGAKCGSACENIIDQEYVLACEGLRMVKLK